MIWKEPLENASGLNIMLHFSEDISAFKKSHKTREIFLSYIYNNHYLFQKTNFIDHSI